MFTRFYLALDHCCHLCPRAVLVWGCGWWRDRGPTVPRPTDLISCPAPLRPRHPARGLGRGERGHGPGRTALTIPPISTCCMPSCPCKPDHVQTLGLWEILLVLLHDDPRPSLLADDEAGKKEVNVIIFHLKNSSDDSDDILLQPSDQMQARLYSAADCSVLCCSVQYCSVLCCSDFIISPSVGE